MEISLRNIRFSSLFAAGDVSRGRTSFLRAKRPQRQRARRNGCFPRLLLPKRDTRILHPELLSSPLYPEYRFLSQSRILIIGESRFLGSRLIPFKFPERTEIPRSVFWSNPGSQKYPSGSRPC